MIFSENRYLLFGIMHCEQFFVRWPSRTLSMRFSTRFLVLHAERQRRTVHAPAGRGVAVADPFDLQGPARTGRGDQRFVRRADKLASRFTGNFAKRAQPCGGGGSGWAFGAGRSCRANTPRRSGRPGNAGGPGHAFFSLRARRSGGPLWTGWARGTLRTRSSLRALKTPR